jgi:hypothetical protein
MTELEKYQGIYSRQSEYPSYGNDDCGKGAWPMSGRKQAQGGNESRPIVGSSCSPAALKRDAHASNVGAVGFFLLNQPTA